MDNQFHGRKGKVCSICVVFYSIMCEIEMVSAYLEVVQSL